MRATNIDATAVNTVGWLSATAAPIVVPVYQRQYRWDIGGCEQLLADVRAVADADERQMHFIGSILSSVGDADGGTELVLIDGQQRVTTLMLLVAALRHTVQERDPGLAAELSGILMLAGHRTRLRPHRAWAEVFERVVTGGADHRAEDSRFDDNYAFFRSQISVSEAPWIWRGLQKLEHVAISLGQGAHAQQIFESLNSTGEPLRDHELIHNYVLMGLTHAEQSEIENEFWLPIEAHTGQAIAAFWRHYLVMTTGREVAAGGEHGVYAAFRAQFPRLDILTLRDLAAGWREASALYGTMLDPARADDPVIACHLGYVAVFGRGAFPLVLQALLDHARGGVDAASLVATLEAVQALLLRRAVVGLGDDRLIARLCRARAEGPDAFIAAIARVTPSDERVRIALRYRDLPHAPYVLGRLSGAVGRAGLEIDHIVPTAPSAVWTGGGALTWAEYDEDAQNSHRALAETLGNLVLLEEPLAERVFDASFPAKRPLYARSALPLTAEVATTPQWGTAAISARTAELTRRFLALWARADTVAIDDDGLTPVLDAIHRRGWPHGWEREFEYTEYRGEHWEVHDVRSLFNRIFRRLWADRRADVLAFSARRGGPIFDAMAWNGQWDALDDAHFLYMGWDSTYMLTAVQGLLQDAGIAHEVFVKYSYIGAAM